MKTKKLYFLFLTVFTLLTIISCNKEKRTYVEAGKKMVETKLGKYRIFEHDKFDYSFYVPVDWRFQKRKNKTVVILSELENKEDKYNEMLDVVVLDAGFKNVENQKVKNKHSLETLYNNQKKVLTGSEYDLEIEQEGEKIINGKKCKWISFNDNKFNRDLRTIKYFMVKDNLAFIITATTQNEKFHIYGPIFNEIFESFKIK